MRRSDFGMSEPQFFDDGLQNLFTRAAAETEDTGFSAEIMASLQRRDRARVFAVAAAGLVGAVIAATQLGALRALMSGVGEQASAALQAESLSSGNALAASPLAVVAAGLALFAAAGIAALIRR